MTLKLRSPGIRILLQSSVKHVFLLAASLAVFQIIHELCSCRRT